MTNIRLGDKGFDGHTLWCDDSDGIPRPLCTFTDYGYDNWARIILELIKGSLTYTRGV